MEPKQPSSESLHNTLVDRQLYENVERLCLRAIVSDNLDAAAMLVRVSDGKIIYMNPFGDKMFGYLPGEMRGLHVSRINAPGDKTPEETADKIISELKENGSWKGEVRNAKKDGTVIWTRTSIVTFFHREYGTVWVSAKQDITEQKATAENLENSRNDLEKTANYLRESNDELIRFSYIIAHDLQEPVRQIRNYVDLFMDRLEGDMDPKLEKYAGYIQDGSNRINDLIHDLLDYSTAISEKDKSSESNLNEVLEVVLKDLKTKISEAGGIVMSSELPVVNADGQRIGRVFQNLIQNAIKFVAKDTTPNIRISAKRQEWCWVISVADNGIGIDPELHDGIFDIFQRLHLKEEYGGTGMGLTLCKKIITSAGGKIWVESELGRGAVFSFSIPDKHLEI